MARRVVRVCGADLVEMSPARHDEAVALVSHLPQVVATLTASRLRDRDADLVALAGQGVRDVTRIAASDPGLWTEILDANAVALSGVLSELQAELALVSEAVGHVGGQASRLLETWMRRSRDKMPCQSSPACSSTATRGERAFRASTEDGPPSLRSSRSSFRTDLASWLGSSLRPVRRT